MKRVMGMVVVAGACLVLAGCSSAESEAVKVAQAYVTGTWKEQCELKTVEEGSRDCSKESTEAVWPNHPTDIESVTEWQGDGYAVVIPGANDTKVIGLREVNGSWKVVNWERMSDTARVQKDPACWALSEDTGIGC